MSKNLYQLQNILSVVVLIYGIWLSPMLYAQGALRRDMLMLTNINTNRGLSSARVYSIMQASDGAMWISTKSGVDRFNGQMVKNYELTTDKLYSDVSGGRNFKLFKDAHQRFYAYDNKGKLYIYNKVSDNFVLVYDLMKVLGVAVVVNEIIADTYGYLWIAMDKGVYQVPAPAANEAMPLNQLPIKEKGRHLLKGLYVNHLRFVGQTLLVGSSKGVLAYLPQKETLKTILPGCAVLSSYHDAATHQLWLGTFHNGIKIIDDRTWQPIPMSVTFKGIPNIPVRSMISYNGQTVLIGIDGAGVYAYDKQSKQISLLLNTDGRPDNALQGNGVYTLYCDQLGDLWIGSYSGGVDLAIPMVHTLEFVRHEYLSNQSIMDNSVNDILQGNDGRIWFATDKGISVFDERTHLWHHGLHNKVALTLCQTHDGRVLVGTYGHGVYEMHADGSAVSVYSQANGYLQTDYVYALYKDSDGDLWIGCLDGNLVHITPTKVSYLPVEEVQCIAASPDGLFVDVGTSHGCYRINRKSHRFTRFYYPEEFPDCDYNYFVNSIAYQDGHHVWIATDGGGLCLYNMHNKKPRFYTVKDALPSNNVYALTKTPEGEVWLSTDKGLAFVDKDKVVNVNLFDGMESEYKRMSWARTHDGRIIFGSNNGAVILSPHFAKKLDYAAPLQIRSIEIEGINHTEQANQRLYDMLQAGKLRLSHAENTLVISFESINYQYQQDIQYQYYLEGYDHQWSNPSAEQQVRFANLPAGSYTLYVKSIGRSNGRILGLTSLRVQILQPWWNTWWAWLVYLSLLVTMFYLGWDYYRERLHRKYNDEKIKFFVNTAHNIRTPLSLVLAPLADLAKDDALGENSRNFLKLAQRNGYKLLQMINELLDFQKIDHTKGGMIQLQNVDLVVLLRQQVDKFMLSAEEKQICLRLGNCPAQILKTDVKIVDLIFENLLSNAVKYTPAGGTIEVSASVDMKKRQVGIYVIDTGMGIPKAETKFIFQNFFRASNAVNSQEMGSGMGLMLTRQLVQKLGGKLSFESEEGRGTTFILTLPLGKKASMRTPVETSVAKLPKLAASADKDSSARNLSEYPASLDEAKEGNSRICDTILFVDDNEDLRQYISMAFSETYHMVCVESGEKALAYLQDNGACDLVVSDLMMPDMQGDELCRRIKSNNDTSWLPVIILTAKAGREFMIEGLGWGADDYITKPFDLSILASKIDSMLKNRRRLSKYYMEQALALVRGNQPTNQPSAVLEEGIDTIAGEEVNAELQTREIDATDQAFVAKATRLVMEHLRDTNFCIDDLCREMAMSRTLFYGKLKTLTGQAPQDFVRMIRLEQAAVFLKQGDTVLDVSVKTGFVNVKYFSTVFKKYFGMPPSKYPPTDK